jgi:hypothetical protein
VTSLAKINLDLASSSPWLPLEAGQVLESTKKFVNARFQVRLGSSKALKSITHGSFEVA